MKSPNHVQRTAPCDTAPASAAAFPPAMQVPRRAPRSLSLGSLGVIERLPCERSRRKTFRVRCLTPSSSALESVAQRFRRPQRLLDSRGGASCLAARVTASVASPVSCYQRTPRARHGGCFPPLSPAAAAPVTRSACVSGGLDSYSDSPAAVSHKFQHSESNAFRQLDPSPPFGFL